jgi:hypothetical protein
MKALILTNAPTTEKEKEKINNTDILKIAVNVARYKADYRVFRDYWLINPNDFSEPVILLNDEDYFKADFPNTTNKNELYFNTGTLTTAIDFAIKQGATDILLIADNTLYGEDFQNGINRGIEDLKKHVSIYKYTKQGNFNIQYKSVDKFIENIER